MTGKPVKYEHLLEESNTYKIENERDYLYNSCAPPSVLRKHNSIYITLLHNPDHGIGQVKDCYQAFMDRIIDWGCINERKTAYSGWHFTRNSNGTPWPHTHAIIYSVKDFKTGHSVARLPRLILNNLQDYWRYLTDWNDWKVCPVGRPFQSDLVYNADGLINYLTGPHNMGQPAQRWMRLPFHNNELVEKKRLEKETIARRRRRHAMPAGFPASSVAARHL